jgi:predicted ATPase
VPFLNLDRRDLLRRFIWLIDALYNNKIRLFISTQVAITDIYQADPKDSYHDESFAFGRTESRLLEMMSKKYLDKSKASLSNPN